MQKRPRLWWAANGAVSGSDLGKNGLFFSCDPGDLFRHNTSVARRQKSRNLGSPVERCLSWGWGFKFCPVPFAHRAARFLLFYVVPTSLLMSAKGTGQELNPQPQDRLLHWRANIPALLPPRCRGVGQIFWRIYLSLMTWTDDGSWLQLNDKSFLRRFKLTHHRGQAHMLTWYLSIFIGLAWKKEKTGQSKIWKEPLYRLASANCLKLIAFLPLIIWSVTEHNQTLQNIIAW